MHLELKKSEIKMVKTLWSCTETRWSITRIKLYRIEKWKWLEENGCDMIIGDDVLFLNFNIKSAVHLKQL